MPLATLRAFCRESSEDGPRDWELVALVSATGDATSDGNSRKTSHYVAGFRLLGTRLGESRQGQALAAEHTSDQ